MNFDDQTPQFFTFNKFENLINILFSIILFYYLSYFIIFCYL